MARFSYRCSGCGERVSFNAYDDEHGTKLEVKCPHCHTTSLITVPEKEEPLWTGKGIAISIILGLIVGAIIFVPKIIDILNEQQQAQQKRAQEKQELYQAQLQKDEALRLQDIREEYNKHYNTFLDDKKNIEENLNTYKRATNINQRISIINRYIYGLSLRRNHAEDFYNFVIRNEADLKAMKVDTYEFKKQIKDMSTADQVILTQMKQDIENYRERQKQLQALQREEEQQYLDLLIKIGSLLI